MPIRAIRSGSMGRQGCAITPRFAAFALLAAVALVIYFTDTQGVYLLPPGGTVKKVQ